jgi:hypothetical protein
VSAGSKLLRPMKEMQGVRFAVGQPAATNRWRKRCVEPLAWTPPPEASSTRPLRVFFVATHKGEQPLQRAHRLC